MNTQVVENQQQDLIANFWDVSVDFYDKKSSKSLLLKLQDDFGYSVNRLLFSLWFSSHFHQLLGKHNLAALSPDLARAEQSVEQLRATRRTFEVRYAKPYAGNINMTRYHMLEGELSLEREIQAILVNRLCQDIQPNSNDILNETLDFLIVENIELLCCNTTNSASYLLGQLSSLWLQRQN